MAGWHTRLWRRVKVAPGVSINFSKSGPSLSVGPRGAKMTFGRHGVRQTLGLPGTGLYATRQLSSRPPRSANPPGVGSPSVTPSTSGPEPTELVAHADGVDAAAAPDDEIVLSFGFATVVGLVFGVVLLIVGLPTGQALTGGVLAGVAGIVYEGLAHHHPGPAKAVVAVTVGLISIATAVVAALSIAVVAGALVGLGSSGRRRRR
jgi:hypothetical protein